MLCRTVLLFASLLAASAGTTRAQGLAQLRLEGALGGSGGPVEIEVGALVKGQAAQLHLHMFAGPRTTGGELVQLLAKRLERAGFEATAPQTNGAGSSVFVEDALFVRVRLGGGLTGTVTACEAPPTAVRLLPPGKGAPPVRLDVAAGTFSPHTRDTGTATLRVEIPEGTPAPGVSERLLKAAQEAGWMADRPGGDAWRPIKMTDGAQITGLSVGLVSAGAWRLEVEMRKP